MPAIPTEHSLSSLYSSEEYDFNGSGAAGLALLFKPTQMARQQEHLKGHQAYDSHSDPSTPESIDRHGQRSKLKAADYSLNLLPNDCLSSADVIPIYGQYPSSRSSLNYINHDNELTSGCDYNHGGTANMINPTLGVHDNYPGYWNAQVHPYQIQPAQSPFGESSLWYYLNQRQYPVYYHRPDMSMLPQNYWSGPATDESSNAPLSQVYSFCIGSVGKGPQRPRRRYEEIERLYKCGWDGCEKAYGTLNHLNAHVTMQSHGLKRTPEEFREIRKEWKARKQQKKIACRTNQKVLAGGQTSDSFLPNVGLPY